MKIVAICLVTVGAAFTTVTHPLRGAEIPAPSSKPAASILLTNKTENTAPARSPYLSAGLPEILKLHKAGVDGAVLLAFVQNSPTAYHPSAKEIIYLRDQGISSEIISAMLRRGGELRDRAAEAAREERSRTTPPPSIPAAPAAPASPAPPQAAAPAPVVVYASQPYPVYTTPTYVTYPAYGYAWPACYNYSYGRPYYSYRCWGSSYYRAGYYPSVYAGYRSGCYPGRGLSVGYGGGRYCGLGGSYRHAGGSYSHGGTSRHGGGFHGRR
jgi:hypothetical protein